MSTTVTLMMHIEVFIISLSDNFKSSVSPSVTPGITVWIWIEVPQALDSASVEEVSTTWASMSWD